MGLAWASLTPLRTGCMHKRRLAPTTPIQKYIHVHVLGDATFASIPTNTRGSQPGASLLNYKQTSVIHAQRRQLAKFFSMKVTYFCNISADSQTLLRGCLYSPRQGVEWMNEWMMNEWMIFLRHTIQRHRAKIGPCDTPTNCHIQSLLYPIRLLYPTRTSDISA